MTGSSFFKDMFYQVNIEQFICETSKNTWLREEVLVVILSATHAL